MIDKKVYAPLHTASYPSEILKELQRKGYLLRCGTLRKVLLEHGLNNRYYRKTRGRNSYRQLISYFKVKKKYLTKDRSR